MTAVSSQAWRRNLGPVFAWLFLLAFETLAQIALKAGGNALTDQPFGGDWLLAAVTSPWVIAGMAGYIGSFCAWMIILDRTPLSFGFPLTAVVMLCVTLAAYVVFGEVLTGWRTAGIALIILGVIVMGGEEA
ncbi:EamA family transporter [Zavarzinia compransoris]|nr:EamA family transporter [Zavarzinia compransoris]TDP46397.1 EamA-like transporter family protein [Zavarzinia compransoris]